MKKLALFASAGAMSFGVNTLNVNAGDWGKAPVDKTPIVECVDVGGEVSVGYETDYVFYGVRFAGDSVWTDVNYTFDGLAIPITIGAWYLNGINDGNDINQGNGAGYDELDLYVSLALGTFAGFEATAGYTHFAFPEFRGDVANTGGYGEANFNLSRSLGFVDLTLGTVYALGGGGTASGWYHEFGLEKTFGLTDSIGFVLGAGVGYTDGYFTAYGPTRDSGWNHYYLTASLPIQLNCRTTLTPYIGYNGAPDTWVADGIDGGVGVPQSDILHGGVSLKVTF
ncbi:MAG: hypothetical protein KA152_03010 [Verrucomicrobiales bacterium]|nr:hypothetical protein [Verrucomicrobiales bacterium]